MNKDTSAVATCLVLLLAAGCGAGLAVDPADGKANGISVCRYDDAGNHSAELSQSVSTEVDVCGEVTEVIVFVEDIEPVLGITLELEYDPAEMSPVGVEFADLVDEPVTFSSTKVPGQIGLGQVTTADAREWTGEFATVKFSNRPCKTVAEAGEVWSTPVDQTYNPNDRLEGRGVEGFSVYSEPYNGLYWEINSLFAQADGNGDGYTSVSDLTPVGRYFNKWYSSEGDYSAAAADYNRDGLVSAGDISILGQAYGQYVTGFEIWVFEEQDLSGEGHRLGDVISWDSGTLGERPDSGQAPEWNQVFRTWSGYIEEEDYAQYEVGTSGVVYLVVRAVNDNGHGAFSTPRTIWLWDTPAGETYIDGFGLRIPDATIDYWDEGVFRDGDVIELVANTETTVQVTDVYGGYWTLDFYGNPQLIPFQGDDGTIDPYTYSEILDLIRQMVEWSFENAGHADMQLTADIVTQTGSDDDMIQISCGPDNDIEDIPEGKLTVRLAAGYVEYYSANSRNRSIPPLFYVPQDIEIEFDVDLVTDIRQPVIAGIETSCGELDGRHLIDGFAETLVTIAFDWGTHVPADLAELAVSLFDLTDRQEVCISGYSGDEPPGPGLYCVLANPDQDESGMQLQLGIGSGVAVPGHLYAVRLGLDGANNSVNFPGEFLIGTPVE